MENYAEILNQINCNNIKNRAGNRKIILWGASKFGKEVINHLLKNEISVSKVIDNKKWNILHEINVGNTSISIEPQKFLEKNTDKYYIIITTNYHEEIEIFLNENSYEEEDDYFYILHKPIIVSSSKCYEDIYGNKIIGTVDNCTITFKGYNSTLIIGENVEFNNSRFLLSDNSTLQIGDYSHIDRAAIDSSCNSNISIGHNTHIVGAMRSFFNSQIQIGNFTTMEGCEIMIEYYTKLIIGEDCMLSSFISIRSNNGHMILDVGTGKSLSKIGTTIRIGNHVWISHKSVLFGDVTIGDGSIVGINSFLINEKFPNNCTIGGNPAKILRKNVVWYRSETDNLDLFKDKEYCHLTNTDSYSNN